MLSALTMKLEANIEAVILRQSVQLQMNVSIRSGFSVGCAWSQGFTCEWVFTER